MTIKYRPRCFFDVEIGGQQAGRVILELFSDVCPITCENFRALCTGEKGLGKTTGKQLHYKGVLFHRVVKDFMVQCGDFSAGNGTGGESIYGGTFKDENFEFKHDRPFLLSMANRGKDTNGSQFFVTTKATPHLDNIHVVFGHAISGQDIITTIENLKADSSSRPLVEARVSNCGELVPKMKPKEKKRKRDVSESTEEGESKSDAGSSSGASEKKKKKKKKRKKSKKHKKEKSKKSESEKQPKEEGEIVEDVICSIKPEEVPEIPKSKFLHRHTSPKEDQEADLKSKVDADRSRRSYQRRQQISRSGRKIKGRGFMRYRTPSRSRSRSRSVTPPHWRLAQARVVPLSEYEKRQLEKQKIDEQRKARQRSQEARQDEYRRDGDGAIYRSRRGEREQDRSAREKVVRTDDDGEDETLENGKSLSTGEDLGRDATGREKVSYPIGHARVYESDAKESDGKRNDKGDDDDRSVHDSVKVSEKPFVQSTGDSEEIESEPPKGVVAKQTDNDDESETEVEQPKRMSEANLPLVKESESKDKRDDEEEVLDDKSKKTDVVKRSNERRARSSSASSHHSEKRKEASPPPRQKSRSKSRRRRRSSGRSPMQSTGSHRRRGSETRTSPRRGRRNEAEVGRSRRPRSRSPSSGSDDGRRLSRRGNASRRRDFSSRFSPRDRRQQRGNYGSSRRRRNRSRTHSSSSQSRSPPPRRRERDVGSPSRAGSKGRSEKRSQSKDRNQDSSQVVQRKLVQDYDSPNRQSDQDRSRSRSPAPPSMTTVDVGNITVPSESVDVYRKRNVAPIRSSSPHEVINEQSKFTSKAPSQKPMEESSPDRGQDMDLDEEDYNGVEPSAVGHEEDERRSAEPKDPLPCSLEDILLPGEFRAEVSSESKAPAPSMWKAIPEATEPTVVVSTLELLHKQQTEQIAEAEKQDDHKSYQEPPLTMESTQLQSLLAARALASSPNKPRSKSRSPVRDRDHRSVSRGRRSLSPRKSRSRSRDRLRRRSRSGSRYRSGDRHRRSRSRQAYGRRRSDSRSRSRGGGRRRRSNSRSRSRRRSPVRPRRQPNRYRPRGGGGRRRSSSPRKRRHSDSRSRSRSSSQSS